MAITSNDDIAEFRNADRPPADITASDDAPSDVAPVDGAAPDSAKAESATSGQHGADTGAGHAGVWVLCRKRANGDVETVRAFDDEARARADLELVDSVSDDEFWVASVPMIETVPGGAGAPGLSRVQALALTWLAKGAEAEASVPLDDPVVVSPRHVRGFVSVPSHEWREMEDRGWVRDGLITPAGAAKVGTTGGDTPGD